MKTFAEMDQEWKEQHSRDLRAQAAASYEGGRLSRDKEVEALRAKLAAFKRIDLDEEIDARYGFMIEKKDAALRQAADKFREQEQQARNGAPIGVCALPQFKEFTPTCINCGASRTMHEHVARQLAKADAAGEMAYACDAALSPEPQDQKGA